MCIIPEGFGCKTPKAFVVSAGPTYRRCRTVRLTPALQQHPQAATFAFPAGAPRSAVATPAGNVITSPNLREVWKRIS